MDARTTARDLIDPRKLTASPRDRQKAAELNERRRQRQRAAAHRRWREQTAR